MTAGRTQGAAREAVRTDAHAMPSEVGALLREAGSLGIPWQRILAREVRAEKVLRRFLAGSDREYALESLLAVLPGAPLDSWRVRDRIERLSWRARQGDDDGGDARRDLRRLDAHLRGRGMPPAQLLEHHLLFAYGRVRELQAIWRAASKSRGPESDRVARVLDRARCSADDALWAVLRTGASRREPLEEAMARAREEGFEIPPGRTEWDAFLGLRDFLERRGLLLPGPEPRVRRKRRPGLREECRTLL